VSYTYVGFITVLFVSFINCVIYSCTCVTYTLYNALLHSLHITVTSCYTKVVFYIVLQYNCVNVVLLYCRLCYSVIIEAML
jgi:hypothetical protein